MTIVVGIILLLGLEYIIKAGRKILVKFCLRNSKILLYYKGILLELRRTADRNEWNKNPHNVGKGRKRKRVREL